LVLATSTFLLAFALPALAVNEYGVATETSANYGSEVRRIEVAVTCVGTGSGFVFDDLWQGIQGDDGWIEIGTEHCASGDPNPRWVWANYLPGAGYYESVLQRNVAVNTTHTFKVWNFSGAHWRVYIDGYSYASAFGFGAGSTANSADVGLEVTQSRMNSTQTYTYESYLRAWSVQGTSQAWSGQDSCTDTDAKIYTKWITAVSWRHTLNVSATQSTCSSS